MLGDIDYSKQPLTPKLYICKPNINRIPIAYLREVYDVNYKEKLSNINELNFKILYELNLDTNSQINPNIGYIKERFIIKLVLGNIEEYFIINKVIDIMDDEDLIKEVQCYSYAYTLSDKIISQFKAESYNATEILSSVLAETNWNIDFIDPSFNDTYRTFDIQSRSVLDMVLSIGETFNGAIKFDTVNRKISLYVNENIGYDKGLTFSYGRYLAGINKEQQIDDFCTRLKCFGKDSLTINEVNPTGKNYVDDFTFFLFPFERDANRNIIKKSNYELSDELCHDLLDWKQKLNDNTTVFNNLLNQKYVTNNLLSIKNTELSALNVNLATIKSELDTAQSLSKPIYALSIEKSNKENQINSKTSEINKLTTKLNKLNQQIYNLQNSLTLENNLSPALMVELNDFIIQKEWSDTNYFTAIDLYTNGIKKLNELRNPITQITIDIVNFLDYIEEQLNWDKIGLGDTVYVKMYIMSINVQCKITEIQRNFENSEITLTITNVKDIETNEYKLYKMLRDSISVSTTISNNKSKWDNASDIANKAYDTINSPWNANEKPIYAGNNNSTIIDNRGFICSDKDDPDKFIRINNNSIIYTKDGGKSYVRLISNGTISGDKITGEIILGDNLTIKNANKSILINKDGITIANTALKITNGLTEDNLGDQVSTWNNSSLNFNIRNDRISIIPSNPTLPIGTIEHTKNTDASCNISFEWNDYNVNIDDAHNIDGFTVYVYNIKPPNPLDPSEPPENYTFGTDKTQEKVYNIDYDKNAMILNGVAIDNYYTFGVQAFRIVDPDIDSNRIIVSDIIQNTTPYQPSSNVAYSGDITGTINGRNVVTVLETLDQASSNATEAISQLEDIASDDKITSTEKKVVQRDWDAIVSEYQIIIDQAANVGLDVSNYIVDNYIDMYIILNNYLVTNSILVDINTTSIVDRETFVENFTNYYNAKIILLKEISDILSNNGVNIAITNGVRNFTFDKDGNNLTTPSAYSVVAIQNGNIIVPTSITWSYAGFLSGNTNTPIVGSFTSNDTYVQASVVVNGITYIERIPISSSKIGQDGEIGESGLNSYNLNLSSNNGYVFKYDKNNNLIAPTSIILTANIINISNATYTWYKNDILISGASAQNYTVNAFGLETNIYKCIVVGMANDLEVTINDTITLTGVQDGADGIDPYYIILSNENVVIPCGENRENPNLSSAYTSISLYKGSTSISATMNVGTPVGCTINSDTVNNIVTITSISADIGYVDIQVKDGDIIAGVKRFNFSVAKQGITGVNAYNMRLVSFSGGLIFKYDKDGNLISPNNIVLFVNTVNISSNTYTWYKDDIEIIGEITDGLVVNPFTENSHNYKCIVSGIANDVNISIYDSVTITKIQDGSDSYSIVLSNESVTIPTDTSGNNPVLDTAFTDIILYKGVNSISPTIGTLINSNCTSSKTGNRVSILSLSGDSGYVDIQIKDGTTIIGTRQFTFSKSKQGIQGITGTNGKTYILNIINGIRTVLYNSDGTGYNPTMTAFGCELYEDGQLIPSESFTSITWSVPLTDTLLSGNSTSSTFTPTLDNIFASSKSNNTITLTVQYAGQTITDIQPISITKIGATGAPGSDANIPAWVTNWSGIANQIGINYILSPYIWAGTSGVSATGVGLGFQRVTDTTYQGIVGYNNGVQTFSLDASTGKLTAIDANITGEFTTLPSASDVVDTTTYLNIKGSKISGKTPVRNYYDIGTAKLSDDSKSGIFRAYSYIDPDNTPDAYMDITRNSITAYQKGLVIVASQGTVIRQNSVVGQLDDIDPSYALDVRGNLKVSGTLNSLSLTTDLSIFTEELKNINISSKPTINNFSNIRHENYVISGSNTAGTPSTGYIYTNEIIPHYNELATDSGYNYSTIDNNGRTGIPYHRTVIYHSGQGDVVCYNGAVSIYGTKINSTHWLANSAGALFNGDVSAYVDGAYLNPYEVNLSDNNYDVAGIGHVLNFHRYNSTGAKSAYWGGIRLQSFGTEPIDNAYTLSGKAKVGLDFTPSDFQINKAAIALKGLDRIYFNATSIADPIGVNWYANNLGNAYMYYDTSLNRITFVNGGNIMAVIGLNGFNVNAGINSVGGVLMVDSIQVVSNRQLAITNPDGTLTSVNNQLIAVLTALRNHGLIAT